MRMLADGSKQRQKLRAKISLEKEELGEMVEKYNKLVSPNKSIQLQEVESGNFPWKTENNDEDAVPIRTKSIVVDKHMEASMFGEELELLQKKIIGFVKFYKNSVLPSLIQQQQNLRDFLKEVDSNGGTRVEESLSHRYSSLSTQKEILMAKLGLVQDGIDFAMKQIAAGIVSFAPVLTDELDEFRQVILTHQIEYQKSYDEESVIDDGDDDEDAEMPSEESCEGDSHFGDIVLDALANIGAAQVFVGPSEEIRAGVTC